jgi:hypothetical protein
VIQNWARHKIGIGTATVCCVYGARTRASLTSGVLLECVDFKQFENCYIDPLHYSQTPLCEQNALNEAFVT